MKSTAMSPGPGRRLTRGKVCGTVNPSGRNLNKDREDGMEGKNRKVRTAELVLILLAVVVILIPQFFTGGEEAAPVSSVQWEQPDDLNGGTFAVVTGSAYDVMIRERFPESRQIQVYTWADEGIMVSQGKADALVREQSSIEELKEEYPNLVPMEEPVGTLVSCWCAPKTAKGVALCEEVNAYLAAEWPGDSLRELYRVWENPENAPDHVDDFPMTGEYKGQLRIVSCLDWAPVCYQNGSNPCGFVIDLVTRFCAWAGYEPVFEFVDFQSALAGFDAGRYDLFAYGFPYQEEAAEIRAFTDPVMQEPVYLVVRKDRYAGTAGETAKAASEGKENLWTRLVRSFEKNFIREDRWRIILGGLGVTVALSVLAAVFGTLLGGVLCAMRMSRRAYPQAFARLWVKILQGTPIVVLLMVLYYLVFGSSSISAFWVCVMGFSMDFSAYVCEIFRSSIEAVPPGQFRAAKALGFRSFGAFVHVVMPQALRHCVPVYIGQLISMVKLTSVAGYISVEDLTRVTDIIRSQTYEAFFPLIFTAVLYFLVASLLTLALRMLQRRIDPTLRTRTVKGVNLHDPEN